VGGDAAMMEMSGAGRPATSSAAGGCGGSEWERWRGSGRRADAPLAAADDSAEMVGGCAADVAGEIGTCVTDDIAAGEGDGERAEAADADGAVEGDADCCGGTKRAARAWPERGECWRRRWRGEAVESDV
jgi:hypothetical protein